MLKLVFLLFAGLKLGKVALTAGRPSTPASGCS